MGIAYGAAKAGLVNLARTPRSSGVRRSSVLTVTVGLIVTEEAHLYYGDEAGMQAVAPTRSRCGAWARPRTSPTADVDVVSPLARWMTATNVHVDGGGEIPSYLTAWTG